VTPLAARGAKGVGGFFAEDNLAQADLGAAVEWLADP